MKSKSKKPKTKRKSKALLPPSKYLDKHVGDARKALVKELATHLNITQKDSESILKDNKLWEQYLEYENKKWTVKGMNELMPVLFDAAKKKGELGWTANAKDAVVAMNILKEKLIDNKQPAVNIGGRNVQVNLGWKFSPYKAKK